MDITTDPLTKRFVIKNGDWVLNSMADAIAQFVGQRLQTWLGEWFLDITEGVPFREKIFVKNPNIVDVETTLKLMIVQSPGVQELTSFNFQFDSAARTAHLDFTAQSQHGEIVFSQDIGA